MAGFEKIDSSSLEVLREYNCYKVVGTLTHEDVEKLKAVKRQIVIIFENTKGQNSEVIKNLKDNKNINISVLGGLDYLKKKKYNAWDYIERTIYKPENLSEIIKIYEEIERKINPLWSDLEKSMFIYKVLSEKMHYKTSDERTKIDGVDYSRTLNCLLKKRAVCAGFALIYKEAMDRIGIECLYQNKSHEHVWNAIKIDGKYQLVDLTWDTYQKSNDGNCLFMYFGQNSKEFYSNTHHDIQDDNEEIRVASMGIPREDIISAYKRVSTPKRTYTSSEMSYHENSLGQTFNYAKLTERDGYSLYIVRRGININYFFLQNGTSIRDYLRDDLLGKACHNNHILNGDRKDKPISKITRYKRDDGTSFVVLKPKAKNIGDIEEYALIDPYSLDGKNVLRRTTIFSENDLTKENDGEFKSLIANFLLSNERLERKVEYNHGYVGYITRDSKMYYDSKYHIEEQRGKRI